MNSDTHSQDHPTPHAPRVLEQCLQELASPDPKVRREAVEGLGQHRGDAHALGALVASLHDPDRDVRHGVALELYWLTERHGAQAVGPTRQTERQRVAAEGLASEGGPRALTGAVQALQDEDPVVRTVAAAALGWLGERQAVEPLVAALRRKDSPLHRSSLQREAAWALSRLGGPQAAEGLVAALQEPDPHVQQEVMNAIVFLRDSALVEPLVALLQNQEVEGSVRQLAATLLGAQGDPQSEAPLRQALHDHDLHIQQAAEEALRHLRKKSGA